MSGASRDASRRAAPAEGRASSVLGGRGTAGQRFRVALLRVAGAALTRLPTRIAGAGADAAGELWYRLTPGRAALARANLGRVCGRLAALQTGSPAARRAAGDERLLERLVRAAYRHAARTYVEMLRQPAVSRELDARLAVENPDAVEAAFAGGPSVFAAMHFGSLQAITEVMSRMTPTTVTSPMEALGDPELQAFVARRRAASGLRLVSLAAARRELRAALGRGEIVGIVADRDVAGGGIAVPLFGCPATLPAGPAMLALERDVPIHVAAVWRRAGERYAGALETILPGEAAAGREGRRAQVEAVLAAEAAAFERLIAVAPEQWWAVFFPIWTDLGPAPRPRGGR